MRLMIEIGSRRLSIVLLMRVLDVNAHMIIMSETFEERTPYYRAGVPASSSKLNPRNNYAMYMYVALGPLNPADNLRRRRVAATSERKGPLACAWQFSSFVHTLPIHSTFRLRGQHPDK